MTTNIDMCLYKHESKVVYSPRGVAWGCSKCDSTFRNKTSRNSKKSNKAASERKFNSKQVKHIS